MTRLTARLLIHYAEQVSMPDWFFPCRLLPLPFVIHDYARRYNREWCFFTRRGRMALHQAYTLSR